VQVTDEQCVGAHCAGVERGGRTAFGSKGKSVNGANSVAGGAGSAGAGSTGVEEQRAAAGAQTAEGDAARANSPELAGRLGQQLQLIQRARRLLRAHDIEKALTTLRMYRELYPDGELLPEANRLSSQAQREMAADE
jgi:TolA-binding protein